MNACPPLSPTASAIVLRAEAASRGGSKFNANSKLDGERGRDDAFEHRAATDRRAPHVYQNGTAERAPLWNGPTLKPVFVAQVIGQVLMDGRASGTAITYRRPAQIRSAHLLDSRL